MKDVTSLTKMSDVEFHTTSRKMADEGCGKWDSVCGLICEERFILNAAHK